MGRAGKPLLAFGGIPPLAALSYSRRLARERRQLTLALRVLAQILGFIRLRLLVIRGVALLLIAAPIGRNTFASRTTERCSTVLKSAEGLCCLSVLLYALERVINVLTKKHVSVKRQIQNFVLHIWTEPSGTQPISCLLRTAAPAKARKAVVAISIAQSHFRRGSLPILQDLPCIQLGSLWKSAYKRRHVAPHLSIVSTQNSQSI